MGGVALGDSARLSFCGTGSEPLAQERVGGVCVENVGAGDGKEGDAVGREGWWRGKGGDVQGGRGYAGGWGRNGGFGEEEGREYGGTEG